MSAPVLTQHPAFFMLRHDGVQNIGASWPAGALVKYRQDQYAIVFENGSYRVLRNACLVDAINAARESFDNGQKNIRVGRIVGKYGTPNLYEEVLALNDAEQPEQAAEYKSGVVEKRLEITKQVGEQIEGFASTPAIDRDNDIIDEKAFNESLDSFMKNPVLLFNHQFNRPIGTVTDLRVMRDQGLLIKANVVDKEIRNLVSTNVLRAFSVQFIIQDSETDTQKSPPIRTITKGELLEISIVSVPANREAIFSVIKSCKDDDFKTLLRSEAEEIATGEAAHDLVEFRSFPVATEDSELGKARDVESRFGKEALELCGARKDGKELYLHHGYQEESDAIELVPSALRLSMAKLIAYHDLSMTEGERRAIWNHLARHYQEINEEAPILGKGPEPSRFLDIAFKQESTSVQTVIVSKERFDTMEEARSWVREHDFKTDKVDETEGSWRFRQFSPDECQDGTLRTIELDNGIRAVVCRKRTERMFIKSEEDEPKQDVTQEEKPAEAEKPKEEKPAIPEPASSESEEDASEPTVEVSDLTAARLELILQGGAPDLDPEIVEQTLNEVEEAAETLLQQQEE